MTPNCGLQAKPTNSVATCQYPQCSAWTEASQCSAANTDRCLLLSSEPLLWNLGIYPPAQGNEMALGHRAIQQRKEHGALEPDMKIIGQLRKASGRAREVLFRSSSGGPGELSHALTLGELGVCLCLITDPLVGEGRCQYF